MLDLIRIVWFTDVQIHDTLVEGITFQVIKLNKYIFINIVIA